jgi:hypothetical protein
MNTPQNPPPSKTGSSSSSPSSAPPNEKPNSYPHPTPLSTTNLKRFRTYAQRQGQKYHMVSHILDGHLEDFFDLLDFQGHQHKHWLERLKEVNPEEFADPNHLDLEYWGGV